MDKDKLELELKIKFYITCKDEDIDKVKEKLDNLGWWILQESRIDKEIKKFPDCNETGYEVIVKKL
jgi:hypothetical protein